MTTSIHIQHGTIRHTGTTIHGDGTPLGTGEHGMTPIGHGGLHGTGTGVGDPLGAGGRAGDGDGLIPPGDGAVLTIRAIPE